MNEALSRVLRRWADSRLYWIPFTGLRPATSAPMGWGIVALHTLSGALWPGLLVAGLARVALGRWSAEAFLIPAAMGFCSSLCWNAMIRFSWNRRTVESQRRLAAGEPLLPLEELRPADRWLVRPAVLLAVLAMGAGIVTQLENLRGNLALRRCEAEFRARNLPVVLADIVPPPVPDERNFALTPLLKPLLDYERPVPKAGEETPSIRWRDTNAFARSQQCLRFEKESPSIRAFAATRARTRAQAQAQTQAGKPGDPGETLESSPNQSWIHGVPVDLGLWQAYYRSLEDWPKPGTPGSPGADVLLGLSRSEPELKELRAAAAARPESRFPLHYEESFGMLLPPLAVMKRGAGLLRLRAVALLAENRPDEALEDVRLAIRLGDSVADEPLLISFLVRVSIHALVLQPVWEGCRDRRWTEAHLAQLQALVARHEPLAGVRRALEGERVLAGITYDTIVRDPERLDGYWDPEDLGMDAGLRWYLRLTPRGWIRQSQVAHYRYVQALVDDIQSAAHHSDLPPGGTRLSEFLDKRSLITVLASMLAPSVDNVTVKAFEAEAWRRLALAGIALERHRLAHGRYPESLAALAPGFLPSVPEDPMDGRPLRYSLQPDGDFHLYSVGRDHSDDGGRRSAGRALNSAHREAALDQVWR